MANYTLLKTQPPVRAEETLYKLPYFEKIGHPELVDPYDQIAPGLYPDEIAYELDSGDLVAVSVETFWLPNGEGVGLIGYARWINEDGSGKLSAAEHQIMSEFSQTIPSVQVLNFTVDELASDVARIVMGDDPQLTYTITTEEGEETHPLIGMDPTVKATADIHTQINIAKQTMGFPKLKL